MNNCKECGHPVILRASKIRLNSKNGVNNYIEHRDGTGMHDKEWATIMLKPYPKRKDEYPVNKMVDRWNSEND